MQPVTRLDDLGVVVSHPAGGGTRIEVIDKRIAGEILSLTPREAAAFAGVIAAKFAETLGEDEQKERDRLLAQTTAAGLIRRRVAERAAERPTNGIHS